MSTRTTVAAIVAGAALALGAGIPAAQATETTIHSTTASAHAAQALNALDARWNAEAAAYRTTLAQLAAGARDQCARRALERRGQRPTGRGSRPRSALKALDARWNAEALFFGLR